ncbi:SDR family oxidoreductase [Streptomyces sp. XM4011]|uniref:SDR family oxidoreductase n=1 Tax=Streptomyces sp. XM4011 TaxID=2929780 RepID=UPI001FFBF489|nr:SDR family oxidoreductase [Streptomyces sp. XM4011]MCK1817628.1 SDR family oxidoreductase [Streptomyces sp. XM4011]
MTTAGRRPARGRRAPRVGPGTIVVVTGASAGVGRAAARAFGGRQATVALLARGRRGLEAAAAEVRAAGGRALVVPVDVADAAAVDAAADRVLAEYGRIDVWVNAAFSTVFGPVGRISAAEIGRATQVTYLGSVHGIQAALRAMAHSGGGTVVQVGSALTYRSVPLQSAYCGAKSALRGFIDALRCELRHDGTPVRLTMVQLPAVNTPQFSWVASHLPGHPRPVAPVYQPEVAARAIVHAARRPRKREYWVGGSTVATLLANRFAPWALERYLARTGYASQQLDRPRPPGAPTALWEPADGPEGEDYGTQGIFGDESAGRSAQLWVSRHRGLLAGLGCVLALAAAGSLAGGGQRARVAALSSSRA